MKDVKKRAAGCIMALIMLFSVIPVYASVTTNASAWAQDKVMEAYSLGLVPDSLLNKAQSNITRKEFCELAIRYYSVSTGNSGTTMGGSPFHDESSPVVAKAYELGIVKGVSDELFMPNDPLMREQLAMLLLNTVKASGVEVDESKNYGMSFKDSGSFSSFAISPVNVLAGEKILNGYDGNFYPKNFVTVEQAIAAFLRTYEVFTRDAVTIGGKELRIGDSRESVIAKFGEPDRIDRNEYGFDKLVYNSDLNNLLMVSISDKGVSDIFTNSSDFVFQGVTGTTSYMDVHTDQNSGNTFEKVVADNYVIKGTVSFDGNTAECVYITDKRLEKVSQKQTEESIKCAAQELLDMINAARNKKGLSLLVWNNSAEKAAVSHSEDMKNGYYEDYINGEGLTPFERMAQNGVQFKSAAESISSQYRNISSVYGDLINTVGTRTNILNPDYTHVGIGIVTNGYRLFVTVDMFR